MSHKKDDRLKWVKWHILVLSSRRPYFCLRALRVVVISIYACRSQKLALINYSIFCVQLGLHICLIRQIASLQFVLSKRLYNWYIDSNQITACETNNLELVLIIKELSI